MNQEVTLIYEGQAGNEIELEFNSIEEAEDYADLKRILEYTIEREEDSYEVIRRKA